MARSIHCASAWLMKMEVEVEVEVGEGEGEEGKCGEETISNLETCDRLHRTAIYLQLAYNYQYIVFYKFAGRT